MTIMKVHYSPTDGIPLNSLYLKETSTTERSGSVLGGGISGDSVILGGGGYAGSEMQKTTRSSVFAPPAEVTAEPDNTKMVLRISCVIGVMFLLIIITLFSNAVVDIFDVSQFSCFPSQSSAILHRSNRSHCTSLERVYNE
ncbi:hypothetical protein [Klebsiella pneumoniae]|uniref:hypothetical protein n=1 Tax=Klebsiella pneumoniae TaxID=573 RepID=UPI0035107C60